jgi:hypothetical protein
VLEGTYFSVSARCVIACAHGNETKMTALCIRVILTDCISSNVTTRAFRLISISRFQNWHFVDFRDVSGNKESFPYWSTSLFWTTLYSPHWVKITFILQKTLNINKCTKSFFSSIITHSYMFRPCWVIFREKPSVIVTLCCTIQFSEIVLLTVHCAVHNQQLLTIIIDEKKLFVHLAAWWL